MKTVSIVTPVFNRQQFVGSTIQSVIKQSFSDWEMIVVDDGSTDGSINIVEDWIKKDNRISLVKRTNEPKGACTCRNLGLQKATGEYVIFLDSDDCLLSTALQQRISIAQQNADCSFIIFPGAVRMDNKGENLFFWNIKTAIPYAERFLAMDSPWQTTGPLWKKQFLIDNNLCWDEDLAMWQDVDFHLRAILQSSAYKVLWNEPYDYVVNACSTDSLSRTSYYDTDKLNARFYFLEKYAAMAGNSFPYEWLKPLFLQVCNQAVSKRLWQKATHIIETAFNYKIITLLESKKMKKDLLLARFSFNRISFPSSKISNSLRTHPSTLQKIPIHG